MSQSWKLGICSLRVHGNTILLLQACMCERELPMHEYSNPMHAYLELIYTNKSDCVFFLWIISSLHALNIPRASRARNWNVNEYRYTCKKGNIWKSRYPPAVASLEHLRQPQQTPYSTLEVPDNCITWYHNDIAMVLELWVFPPYLNIVQ